MKGVSITVILVVIDLGGTILIFHKSPKSKDYCIDMHIGSLLYSFMIFLNRFESFGFSPRVCHPLPSSILFIHE